MAIIVHCGIASAGAKIFSDLVGMVIAHGVLDDLGVASGHAPLTTDLKPGPIRLARQGGEQEVYYISGGFPEVQPNMVKALVDTVVRTGDLDEAAAQGVPKTIEKALQGKGAEPGHNTAVACLAEAAAQLCTVQQLRKKFGG